MRWQVRVVGARSRTTPYGSKLDTKVAEGSGCRFRRAPPPPWRPRLHRFLLGSCRKCRLPSRFFQGPCAALSAHHRAVWASLPRCSTRSGPSERFVSGAPRWSGGTRTSAERPQALRSGSHSEKTVRTAGSASVRRPLLAATCAEICLKSGSRSGRGLAVTEGVRSPGAIVRSLRTDSKGEAAPDLIATKGDSHEGQEQRQRWKEEHQQRRPLAEPSGLADRRWLASDGPPTRDKRGPRPALRR